MEPTIIEQAAPYPPAEPKKNRTGMIIAIVVGLLCCCCLVLGATLWFTGDAIVEMINSAGILSQ